MIILNEEQEKIRQLAVSWFFNSSEQLFEYSGPAGTGKSVLIFEILKSLGLKENQYMPMAYTGAAAIVMRTKGFLTAKSIHSSLYEVVETYEDENNDITRKAFGLGSRKVTKFQLRTWIDPNVKLLFIDEAYMVPKYMVRDILSFGIKVIACGDPNQLPPIGDNPGFLVGYGVHRLTQLMRQSKNNPIIFLANRAMKGEPIHCGSYGNDVLVINDTDFIPEMIGFADAIICGLNNTRDTLNNYVRSLLGYQDYQMPLYGERIICRNNNWNFVRGGIALTNGLAGTVLNQPDISGMNKYSDTFRVDFAPDLIQGITFENVLVNSDYFTGTREIKNRIKEQAKHYGVRGELFEFAYALTTHLAQGQEYFNGIYVEEFMRQNIQNQLNYTGITRFKNKLIYVRKTNKYFYIPQSK